jgi:hypothetical protein
MASLLFDIQFIFLTWHFVDIRVVVLQAEVEKMGTVAGARREELQKAESGKPKALTNIKAITMPIYKLLLN